MTKPTGRPTKYTDELAARICEEIALGSSLRSICKSEDMPGMSTVFTWLKEHIDFQEQYARAKEVQADTYEDMMIDTARTEEDVQRARLIVDTMKWTASKLKPKKYGEKIDMTTDGKPLPAPIYGGLSIQNQESDNGAV